MTETTKINPVETSSYAGTSLSDTQKIIIEKAVIDEVRKQLEAETGILKSALGISAKILGFSLAVLVALFSWLGWQTWSDIKSEASNVIEKKIDKQLSDVNSETNIKEHLTNTLNQALLTSILLNQTRFRSSSTELSESDWNRIRTWIQKENLPTNDFEDAIRVLNTQSSNRKYLDSKNIFAAMLNPGNNEILRWTNNRPDKKILILNLSESNYLIDSALLLLEDARQTQSVRLAAARFIEKNPSNNPEIARRIWAIYEHLEEDDILKSPAFAASAMSGIGSKIIMDRLNQVAKSNNKALLSKMTTELFASSIAITSSQTQAKFKINLNQFLDSHFFDLAFKSGMRIEFTPPSLKTPRTSPFTDFAKISKSIATFNVSSDNTNNYIEGWYFSTFELFSVSQYWNYLSNLASRGDTRQLAYALPSVSSSSFGYSPDNYSADFDNNGAIPISVPESSTIEIESNNNKIAIHSEKYISLRAIVKRRSKPSPQANPFPGYVLEREIYIEWIDKKSNKTRLDKLLSIKGDGITIAPQRSSLLLEF